MLWVYFNYPNSRVTVHRTRCGHVEQAKKTGQRRVTLTQDNALTELLRFVERQVDFAAKAANNDMWVVVDLGRESEDEAIVRAIHSLLAERYKRFRACTPQRHC